MAVLYTYILYSASPTEVSDTAFSNNFTKYRFELRPGPGNFPSRPGNFPVVPGLDGLVIGWLKIDGPVTDDIYTFEI